MATRNSPSVDDAAVELPPAIPLDVPRLTRLSWELGSRVLEDEAARLQSTWEDTETPWKLSIFRATDATVVLKVRTPVGRERFYGAAELDLEAAVATLETAPSWRRVD
ncbi:hypothetical protein [Natronococcus occultus]|uniref:Uncharacterized protein n=1 Tax=Natronococcus occultus SP4 TaxID=694430 RepID=L0JYB4_9EURY|nr:hypothetical protein [Natronococcus occultus]AGB37751.1 hypothetical protein Natoc_1961 [Natronococcus occultus SP4]